MPAPAAPAVPHAHDSRPPRALLMACAALVVFALLGVSVVRLTGSTHTSDWRPLTVDTLSFQFVDGEGGEILAIDADTGAVVHTWAPETGGFVRTSLRSLALDRARDGIGAGPPFSLHLTGNGRFILEDPATGQWISLDAFGKDNVAEFARLFEEGRAAR
ncbi:MAG: phosphonate-binding protein [Hyphomonas sp.]|uniref:photosynthetic complex assembly protein PuhC n=1 Tax=Hyphomonas sp. TaxID=87 RepID=UPI001DCEAF13|nr:photosynthetic complex assembly protein PuhC [Hyphomonas sp.]MBA4225938.1 phosphonate-binding protein [Hyphomonas sp.]